MASAEMDVYRQFQQTGVPSRYHAERIAARRIWAPCSQTRRAAPCGSPVDRHAAPVSEDRETRAGRSFESPSGRISYRGRVDGSGG